MTEALQGLYFAVFAFSDVVGRLGGLTLLFLLPAALWLVSLLCATLVFLPHRRAGADLDDLSPTAWTALRDAYAAALREKLRWLHWSHGLLVASGVAVLILLATLALLAPAPPSGPTQVVIVTPTP